MVTFDPRDLDWDDWCARMAELFAANQLGTVPEENWTDWASGMQGIGYFVESAIPDPRGYNDWQDWATSLVGIINVDTKQR